MSVLASEPAQLANAAFELGAEPSHIFIQMRDFATQLFDCEAIDPGLVYLGVAHRQVCGQSIEVLVGRLKLSAHSLCYRKICDHGVAVDGTLGEASASSGCLRQLKQANL
jgi:hypothetical protein